MKNWINNNDEAILAKKQRAEENIGMCFSTIPKLQNMEMKLFSIRSKKPKTFLKTYSLQKIIA